MYCIFQGFKDNIYRQRRKYFVEVAMNYKLWVTVSKCPQIGSHTIYMNMNIFCEFILQWPAYSTHWVHTRGGKDLGSGVSGAH